MNVGGRVIRTQRDVEQLKIEMRGNVNWLINKKMMADIQRACYWTCLGSEFCTALTGAQEECLSTCMENYRMAQYIVSAAALARSEQPESVIDSRQYD
jgi:hypothetical protein